MPNACASGTFDPGDIPIGTFDSIPEALHYAVDSLINRGRDYIINVRGPREMDASQVATIQVVPAHHVYEGRELGLTIHLPFDPASGTFGELTEFLDMQGHDLFDEYRYEGIPCFVINLGLDVDLTNRVLLYLLERVYQYPQGTAMVCEVTDEGPLRASESAQSLLVHADRVPLRNDHGGVIRVGTGRVSLDLIVEQYENGMTPEEIAHAYDALELADVHAVIAYYLRHRQEIQGYLARRGTEAQLLRAKIENERPRISRSDLLARRGAGKKDHAPAGD